MNPRRLENNGNKLTLGRLIGGFLILVAVVAVLYGMLFGVIPTSKSPDQITPSPRVTTTALNYNGGPHEQPR